MDIPPRFLSEGSILSGAGKEDKDPACQTDGRQASPTATPFDKLRASRDKPLDGLGGKSGFAYSFAVASGRWDSDPRHPRWQRGALPLSYARGCNHSMISHLARGSRGVAGRAVWVCSRSTGHPACNAPPAAAKLHALPDFMGTNRPPADAGGLHALPDHGRGRPCHMPIRTAAHIAVRQAHRPERSRGAAVAPGGAERVGQGRSWRPRRICQALARNWRAGVWSAWPARPVLAGQTRTMASCAAAR